MIDGETPGFEGIQKMMKNKRRVVTIVAAVMLAGCSTPKPPSEFEKNFEDETKTWQEVQAELPPAPNERDLVVFPVSGASHYRFSIDTYSLSIGSDGVFRYVLVATSDQGARNVTYEGIRCESMERKLYAIGQPNGSWVRSRDAVWVPIAEVGNNRQHAALMKEYFCPESYPARKLSEIVGRLKVHLPATIL